jgi:hypothetical protein
MTPPGTSLHPLMPMIQLKASQIAAGDVKFSPLLIVD